MTRPDISDWNGCPVRYFAGLFGDKWSLVILRDLMFMGKRSYGAFLGSGEGIATNVLAARLKHLEEIGVVRRETPAARGARAVYLLTERGRSLLPVLLAIIEWSAANDPQSEAPASFVAEIRQAPEALRQRLEAAIAEADGQALG